MDLKPGVHIVAILRTMSDEQLDDFDQRLKWAVNDEQCPELERETGCALVRDIALVRAERVLLFSDDDIPRDAA